VAISGSGFLKVEMQTPAGHAAGYTRYGALFLNGDGRLGVSTESNFYPLFPPVRLPIGAGNVTVKIDGAVQYTLAGSNTRQAAGKVLVWRFADPRGLNPRADRLYVETAASGPAAADLPGHRGARYLEAGYLEKSNADPFRQFPPNDGM